MKATLKTVSEMIAEANDLFTDKHQSIDTVIGIMDKVLRQQGMNTDAISVDCIPLNKKIIFLLHDAKPQQVDIAFGNKAGKISSALQVSLATLKTTEIVEYMENYFI